MIVTLPWLPGVNNLFKNVGRRRARTERYSAWAADAAVWLLQQRPLRVSGPFTVEMTYERPDMRKRDLDGLAKAPLDLLVSAGVIDDDHLAERITLAWSPYPPRSPGLVVIELQVVR